MSHGVIVAVRIVVVTGLFDLLARWMGVRHVFPLSTLIPAMYAWVILLLVGIFVGWL
ncbi:MAG: hypothetical protein U0172_03620 [Nitrospiraceae bacterium]